MRVSVTDLVGKPGATRHVHESVVRDEVDDAPDAWGPASDSLRDPIVLDVDLDSLTDGILVRGTIDADLVVPCSRCLVDQTIEQTFTVAELFADPTRVDDVDDHDYRLDDERTHLDLSALLRDTIVMEVPVQLLCRSDCQGLCPECGANRNETDCGHRPGAGMDPRWAELADLELPPG